MRLQLQQEENREGNKNEDEENNNRRDDSRKTDPFDGASNNLLRSMREEMDELKNVMREKMDKNLDGMVKRTDSPFTTKSFVRKIIRAGYFWPTMQHYAADFVKKCDTCQRYGNIQWVPREKMTTISSPWTFA